jgi:phage gpG-like protein
LFSSLSLRRVRRRAAPRHAGTFFHFKRALRGRCALEALAVRRMYAHRERTLSEVTVTKAFSLLGFIAELPAIERDLHASGPKIIERACQIVQKKAKAAIGKDHEMWAPLAESTIADKAQHGFATPKPLLRTGELRDSIEYTVHGNQGWVGSDLEIAVYQELGTSRGLPPRSFLVSSAISSEDKIRRLAAATTIAALSGFGHNAHSVREILHLAGHVLREFKELGEDLLGDDEDNEGGRKK